MPSYLKTIFIFFIIISCNCCSEESNEILLKQEVDFKMKKYVHKKLNKCKNDALEDAEIHVDSIITEVTKNAVKNDLDFPERPERDTSSEKFDFKIDSVELDEAVDSLELFDSKTKEDTIKSLKILK